MSSSYKPVKHFDLLTVLFFLDLFLNCGSSCQMGWRCHSRHPVVWKADTEMVKSFLPVCLQVRFNLQYRQQPTFSFSGTRHTWRRPTCSYKGVSRMGSAIWLPLSAQKIPLQLKQGDLLVWIVQIVLCVNAVCFKIPFFWGWVRSNYSCWQLWWVSR